MTRALVLLAEGFEEIEAVTIIDVLRRAEVSVTTASLAAAQVRGAHDITIEADTSLDQVEAAQFDALVLPGGTAGARRLREDQRVLALARAFAGAGKWTAAVCAGPTAFEAAGILAGRRATAYPGNALPSAIFEEERVVEDGRLITSRGPGTSLEFALTLAARFANPETAARLRQAMLVSTGS